MSFLSFQIGFVMFHVRSPSEGGLESINEALSVVWQVVCSKYFLCRIQTYFDLHFIFFYVIFKCYFMVNHNYVWLMFLNVLCKYIYIYIYIYIFIYIWAMLYVDLFLLLMLMDA